MVIDKSTQHGPLSAVRRGSILILVLGILALMAVIAAVYVTIGLGDQRSARAVEARQDRDAIGASIGEYVAEQIAQDRLDITWRAGTNDTGLAPQPYRETTDYPSTDFTSLSIPEEGDISGRRYPVNQVNHYRFRPSGEHPNPWHQLPRPDLDPRMPSDPWLASTEPTFLGQPSEREFPADPTKWWLDNRDWMQISNVAPDGLFVNLFALRNNFDADRGFRNQDQMSYWLSLVAKGNGGLLQATEFLPWGARADKNRPFHWTMYQRNMFFPINQPFLFLTRQTLGGGTAGWGSPDYPAYQYADADGDGFVDSRWFELRDSTFLGQELNLLPGVKDYRVFAAVRVMDLSGLVNVNTATDNSVAPTLEAPLGTSVAEIDLRRVLTMHDLAMDFTSTIPEVISVDPTLTYSSISRPERWQTALVEHGNSDYSMYDATRLTTGPNGSAMTTELIGWYAYDALRRAIQNDPSFTPPSVVGYLEPGFGDVSDYDEAEQLVPFSPFEYNMYLKADGSESDTLLGDMDFRAMNRRRYAVQVGSLDPLAPAFRPSDLEEADERFGWAIFGLSDLSELLTYRGLNDPATTSRLEAALDGRLDDENYTNQAYWQTTRRFGPMRSNRELKYERLGLDDRNRGEEFGPGSLASSDGLIDDDAMALMALSPRALLTTISGGSEIRNRGFLWNRDWRVDGTNEWSMLPGGLSNEEKREYELSGRHTALFHWMRDPGEPIDEPKRIVTWTEAKPYLLDVAGNVPALFEIYRTALAGYSTVDAAWTGDETNLGYLTYRTLFYGFGGPELAMRTAAHMAVNFKDQADGDSEPSVATLIASVTNPDVDDWDQNPTVDPLVNSIENTDQGRNYPGGLPGRRLIPPYAWGDNAGLAESSAINIFGIEAQPFLVEAMSINIYTDAPRHNPPPRPDPYQDDPDGDRDHITSGCSGAPGPGLQPPPAPTVTIGGKLTSGDWSSNATVWEKNSDLVMQVFAVKLHNPFNVPVVLGGGTSGPAPLSRNDEGSCPNCDVELEGVRAFDYYVEFGGRYFKLAKYEPPIADEILADDNTPRGYGQSAVTMQPGETRVFYALGQEDEEEIIKRWRRYLTEYGYGNPTFVEIQQVFNDWIRRQFQDSGGAEPVWMRRFNPESGLLINAYDGCDVDPDTEPDCRRGSWNPSWDQRLTFEDLFEDPRRDLSYRDEQTRLFPTLASGGNGPRDPEFQVVRLWRKITVGEDETRWNGSVSDSDNWLENDLLVDRLREPNPDTLTMPDPGLYPDPALRFGHLDSRLAFAGGYGGDLTSEPRIIGTEGRCQDTRQSFLVGTETYANHNTGLTIASHAFIRRRGFTAASDALNAGNLLRGVLPQWCIESIQNRRSPTSTDYQGEGKPQNIKGGQVPADAALDLTDFGTAPYSSAWFGPVIGFTPLPVGVVGMSGPVEVTFNQRPEEWNNPLQTNLLDDTLYARAGGPASRSGGGALNPELHVRNDGLVYDNGTEEVDISRVTDLLKPWAIGPEYDPFPVEITPGNGVPDDNDASLRGRWLTLSEAIALALAFEREPEGVYSRYTYFDPHQRHVRSVSDPRPDDRPGAAPTGEMEYVFDRCQLRLDRFVPFVNIDQDVNGFFDVTAGDRVLGDGVPMALSLLDSVQTSVHGGWNSVLRRPVPGKVNINTAPLRVLRSIGILSPGEGFDALGMPENWMWRLAGEYGGLGTSSSQDPDQYAAWVSGQPTSLTDFGNLGVPDARTMDAAATIFSYRDRTGQIPFRYASTPQSLIDNNFGQSDGGWNWGFVPYASPGTGFTQPDLFTVDVNESRLVENNRAYDPTLRVAPDRGREALTGIIGIRESPGFASLGEVLAARFRKDFVETFPAGANQMRLTNLEAGLAGVDLMARDQKPATAGLPMPTQGRMVTFESTGAGEEFIVRLESGGYTADQLSDELGNDYDEQLAMASQVLELVTTRSDYFAVWFVVHGYTREDVSNLTGDVNNLNAQNADPLVPSFARRYLMVIDRSEVGTWEDRNNDGRVGESEIVTKPKVVLFREVPM
ncbi:MAG: hypothetical protein DYG94_02280 [Leptolyngbya sp. PLA3]|nr:MAG: hypothetical protein EDM82_02275 [Cyanobacteria bacterium CYA]MCE7967557.1 hypothetical protein [Leptolyngbya sp. PL-A3]